MPTLRKNEDDEHDEYTALHLKCLFKPDLMMPEEGLALQSLMRDHPSTCDRCHATEGFDLSLQMHIHPSVSEPCTYQV